MGTPVNQLEIFVAVRLLERLYEGHDGEHRHD